MGDLHCYGAFLGPLYIGIFAIVMGHTVLCYVGRLPLLWGALSAFPMFSCLRLIGL
jgi:hypothetical protein